MKYQRIRKDGTRETVIVPPTGAPIWIEGEPEWHFWLLFVTYCVLLPLGLIAFFVWAIWFA